MYVSLHNRSAYSFGSSLIQVEALPVWAAFHDLPAVALTDLHGLYGAVAFQQACAERGIKPIFGTELRIRLSCESAVSLKSQALDVTSRSSHRTSHFRFHATEADQHLVLTLLAQSLRGYTNLCQLISLHHLRQPEGEKDTVTLDLCDVLEHAEDVICLVGRVCFMEGPITALSARDDVRDGIPAEVGARKNSRTSGGGDSSYLTSHVSRLTSRISRPASHFSPLISHVSLLPGSDSFSLSHLRTVPLLLAALRDVFGERLYVELAIHTPADVPLARQRARIADELGIPVVATPEARCLVREDNDMLRALASIGTLTLIDRPHPDKPEGFWHLRTPREMQHLFARRPDALQNTLKIAEQCNVRLDLSQNRFPAFESPDGRPAIVHLREICLAGCRRRYIERPPCRGLGGTRPRWDEVIARLDRELRIIEQVQYAEYFLVFHEILHYCNSQGIATLARGSAADSLVCYALGVSQACPFRFDLPFDRFVNPERAKFSKMADIDLDLPWDQRDQVIRWVYERWGHDRVAMIGTANTFHGRAALAELGKAYGLPAHEVYRATKLLPRSAATTLQTAVKNLPEARDIPINEEPYRTILRTAGRLEGLPRHWAMHPCGIVISPEPLGGLVPVQRSPKGMLVAQYDMEAIEELGFIKIDLLGQAGLSVLRDTVAEVRRTEGIEIDLERDVDYSEAGTWDMIASGQARGVHHIESPAMTSLLVQSNCRDIDCLTTIVALIRPGASNQGKKEVFCRRHQGYEPPTYAHPTLVPVLEKTYGLMVFEEHILQIAVEFAGMNVGRADVLRRALNKENRKLIAQMQREFRDSALACGRTIEEIRAVWEVVSAFAGFMFNKAHSAEYALEAFQGAWLKRRWPAHYLAAILSNYRGFYAHSPTLPQILYVLEALRLGARFLPPCVNRSRPAFAVERGHHEDTKTRRGSEWKNGRADGSTTDRQTREPEAPARGSTHRHPFDSQISNLKSDISNLKCETSDEDSPQPPGWLIRVPLSHIKGLPDEFAQRWWSERQKGEFTSISDFLTRCRPTPSEAQLLLDTGALDVFGHSRPELFWYLRSIDSGPQSSSLFVSQPSTGVAPASRRCSSEGAKVHSQGRQPLASETPPNKVPEGGDRGVDAPALDAPAPPLSPLRGSNAGEAGGSRDSRPGLNTVPRFAGSENARPLNTSLRSAGSDLPPVALTEPDAWARARRELELLEFPVTLDPFTVLGRDERGRDIDWSHYISVNRLHEHLGRRVQVCGIMVADRINVATTGELMKFVTLADRTGFVETILFPDTYRRLGHLTITNPIIAATALVEPFENRRGFTLRVLHLAEPLRRSRKDDRGNTHR